LLVLANLVLPAIAVGGLGLLLWRGLTRPSVRAYLDEP
jgi:hypothetical protein